MRFRRQRFLCGLCVSGVRGCVGPWLSPVPSFALQRSRRDLRVSEPSKVTGGHERTPFYGLFFLQLRICPWRRSAAGQEAWDRPATKGHKAHAGVGSSCPGALGAPCPQQCRTRWGRAVTPRSAPAGSVSEVRQRSSLWCALRTAYGTQSTALNEGHSLAAALAAWVTVFLSWVRGARPESE